MYIQSLAKRLAELISKHWHRLLWPVHFLSFSINYPHH